MGCALFACTNDSAKEVENLDKEPATAVYQLSPFEQEIQKMLAGEEGDEKILREFLRGKERGISKSILLSGVSTFEVRNRSKPKNDAIIRTLNSIDLLYEKEREQVVLEDIEKRLSNQYKKESQGR